MGLEACESNDLAWRSRLSPWFHGLGKESAGQRVGSRSNAYHTAVGHGGLGGLLAGPCLEKHPRLTAVHAAAMARSVPASDGSFMLV